MLVWEISLKGFLGQDSAVFDDFGDPSGASEDLGGSLHHSKQHKFVSLGIEAHRDGQDGILEASRVDF